MAAHIEYKGEIINWTNGTGSAVGHGELVRIGSYINGITLVDIANGSAGSVQTCGVVTVTKTAGYAAAQGAVAYYDVADKAVNNDTGNVLVGYYAKAAASGDLTAEISLQPVNVVSALA